MANAIILLADGFEEIEALTTVDVLRRGGVNVAMASVSAGSEVRGAHGMTVRADVLLKDLEDELFDAIILPGGGEGTENLKSSEAVMEALHRHKEGNRLICAICAAPTVLVAAGVLEPGQHITCYPTCVMELDRRAAGVPVVVDGNVITGQAPGASMLFALVILKALTTDAVAGKVARGLVTDVLD